MKEQQRALCNFVCPAPGCDGKCDLVFKHHCDHNCSEKGHTWPSEDWDKAAYDDVPKSLFCLTPCPNPSCPGTCGKKAEHHADHFCYACEHTW